MSCVRLFCDSKDGSLPGFSVHQISQARILEWVAVSPTRGSSPPRNQTYVSCICRQILYYLGSPPLKLLKANSKGDCGGLIWDWLKTMTASLEQVHGFQRQLLWQSYPSRKHTRAKVLGRPWQWRTMLSSHFYSPQTQAQCLVKGSLSINICWKK